MVANTSGQINDRLSYKAHEKGKQMKPGGKKKERGRNRALTPCLLWKQGRIFVYRLGGLVGCCLFMGREGIKLTRCVNPGDPCSTVPAVTFRDTSAAWGKFRRSVRRVPSTMGFLVSFLGRNAVLLVLLLPTGGEVHAGGGEHGVSTHPFPCGSATGLRVGHGRLGSTSVPFGLVTQFSPLT